MNIHNWHGHGILRIQWRPTFYGSSLLYIFELNRVGHVMLFLCLPFVFACQRKTTPDWLLEPSYLRSMYVHARLSWADNNLYQMTGQCNHHHHHHSNPPFCLWLSGRPASFFTFSPCNGNFPQSRSFLYGDISETFSFSRNYFSLFPVWLLS